MAHEITGRYAIVDGARAYYDLCGSGIPLVCIHMGWACSLQWHYFMPIMAAAGFKVIAPDLPGHAKSMPVNWKPFRKMRDYAEWYGILSRRSVRARNPSSAAAESAAT